MNTNERTTRETIADTNESVDPDTTGAPQDEPARSETIQAPPSGLEDASSDPRDVDQYGDDPTAAEGALDEHDG